MAACRGILIARATSSSTDAARASQSAWQEVCLWVSLLEDREVEQATAQQTATMMVVSSARLPRLLILSRCSTAAHPSLHLAVQPLLATPKPPLSNDLIESARARSANDSTTQRCSRLAPLLPYSLNSMLRALARHLFASQCP